MPTVNEKLQSASISHQVDMQQYSNAEVAKIIALLNRVDADLAARLSAAIDRMGRDRFTVQYMEQMLGSVRELNQQVYAQVATQVTADMEALAAYEVDYQQQLFTTTIPAPVFSAVPLVGVTMDQVRAAAFSRPFQGKLLNEWLTDVEAGRAAQIRDAIRIGMVSGQTTDQIVRNIMGVRSEGYADGLINRSRQDIEAVVRTAISHVAQGARDAFYLANDDLMSGVKWLSTLDGRTSAPCRLRDGLTYTTETHRPVGHSVPWLSGPGRLHFNAIPKGSLIETISGPMKVECVSVGDLVLTHEGTFKPVTDKLSKRNESGVIRSVYLESGRILRATHDHPVIVAGGGWRFVGALKVGDNLFCDAQQPPEVISGSGEVVSAPKDRPSSCDESGISLARTLELVASGIDFKSKAPIGPCEVENIAIESVLRNPALIKSKSGQHHLFALAHLLGEHGAQALGELLASLMAHDVATHSIGGLGIESGCLFGGERLSENFRVLGGVTLTHADGVGGVHGMAILGQAEGPVGLAGRGYASTGSEVLLSLICPVPDGDIHDLGVSGEAAVSQSMLALNCSQGKTILDVLIQNELAMVGERFRHDRVLAIEVSDYDDTVYDLGVEGCSSYVCNGIVVSNCRSTSTPIIKAWEELGLTAEEIGEGTRSSLDGYVPESTTYGEWLKRQPASRQDEVLGPTRGKLFRSGGLELDRFYNQKGQYLDLDQLRARDAAAFEKAGLAA